MNVSLNWLSHYIDLEGLDAQAMADMLTFAGVEVENIREKGVSTDLVVVAQVKKKAPVEGSDHLNVCMVDAGEGSLRQIVCGAANYKVGDKVPCALPGSVLPGNFEIKVGKMRGVESRGMLCSASELGLPDKEHGLWILPNDLPVGTPVKNLVDSDTVFELEITPNRPDLLSHWGIARELAGISGRALSEDPSEKAAQALETVSAGDFIRLDAPEICPLYTATRISGVKIAPSPAWLARRLNAIGLRPINNIVDITNYVLHEIGQPLHAFDASKIQGGIVVRRAREGEVFHALIGGDFALSPDDLVIGDRSGAALALGGVMGGVESGVTDTTTDIVLEAAWFNRSAIRSTSRKLALTSDSSYRYERGLSPWTTLRAAARAAELILELAGGTAEPTLVAGQAPTLAAEDTAAIASVVEQGTNAKIFYATDSVRLEWKALDRLTGGAVPHMEAAAILKRLGLSDADGRGLWLCPPWRLDLKRDCDLIEEIVRVYGINNIPSRRITLFTEESTVDRSHDFRMALIRKLAGAGLREVQTIKLIAAESQDPLIAQACHSLPIRPLQSGDLISVALPLSEDHSILRPSLAPGLLAVASRNVNQGLNVLRFFECGRVFRNTGGGKGRDIEAEVLGILLSGKSSPASWCNRRPASVGQADLTALLEVLVPRMPITLSPAKPRSEAALGADIHINGASCGYLARVALDRCRRLNLPEETYYAEIDLRKLQDAATATVRARELPQFPGSSRDAAIDVPVQTKNSEIMRAIAAAKQRLLVNAKCCDMFSDPTGERLAADRKSLTYTFLYRSKDKTLTANEVDAAHKEVLDALTKQIRTLRFR